MLKVLFYVLIPVLFFEVGCSGRNIHPELKEDSKVLQRLWTLEPQWEHSQNDQNAGNAVNAMISSRVSELTLSDQGTEYSNAVMYDKTLIYGIQKAGLIALYPTLGQQRWVLPIVGGVSSEILVEKSMLYFGAGDGYFYAVDAETGRVHWRYEIKVPTLSKPTVSGGRVFVTSADDTVYAFDAGTGKWLWHYRRRTASTSSIHGASQPLVDGNEVLVGLSDGFLVALSLEDGQLKWERKLHQGTKFTDVDAHPIVENGVIYISSYDGALYALKRQGGEILWRFDSGASKQILIDGDRIFLPSTDGNIYALQKSNAKVLWSFELDHGTPTQLIQTETQLVLGSSFQYVYVIDKSTGKGLYRFNVGYGSGFYGSPAFDPSLRRVYFLSGIGKLYAFKLPVLQRAGLPSSVSGLKSNK